MATRKGSSLCKVCMYKVSSGTLNLYSSLRYSQILVTGSLSTSWQQDFRYGSLSTSSQSDFHHSQNLQTSKHGQPHTIQYNTIQIVRAHARNLTMAAAGHAYGMARAAPGINFQYCCIWTENVVCFLQRIVIQYGNLRTKYRIKSVVVEYVNLCSRPDTFFASELLASKALWIQLKISEKKQG